MERAFLAATVGFLSAGTLAYEILHLRVFSITQFHHFAYLAVGVAMLGFGASGVLMALRPRVDGRQAVRDLTWAAIAAPLAFVLSPAVALRWPIDATRLPWDPGQWPLLMALEVVLALPFGVAGLGTLLALALAARKPGGIYASSFVGAGCGAAASILVMMVMLPERALAVPALIAVPGALLAARLSSERSTARYAGWGVVVLTAAVVALPPWRLEVSPYKGLPQVLAYPGARRISEAASPVGWFVEAEAPAFRYAPGLSLEFHGVFPRQRGLFVDGQLAGAVSDTGQERAVRGLVEHLPTALPYAVGARERVLVIGAGDGLEVAGALAHGAKEVTALELHPELARRVRASSESGSRVRWRIGDARSLLARSQGRFDLITLGVGGAFGAAAGGVHALDEDFLHTSDAYELYLRRLSDRGVLAITRWLVGPPREPIRAILTASEALRRARGETASCELFVARSWATVTILVKPSGFSEAEIARLRDWASAHGFDVDWHAGLQEASRAEFHMLESPDLFRAAQAGMGGAQASADFASRYPFLVAPVSDARPYARHFLRAETVPHLLRGDRGALLPFAEWGFVSLLATLIVSVAAAALLLIVPLAVLRGEAAGIGRIRLLAYFGTIGFAYLAAEIAAIQVLGLLLGHPVYAAATVLAFLLVFSGAGSLWSDRLRAKRAVVVPAALSLLLAIYAFILLPAVHTVQPASLPMRGAMALLVLAPPALLMGVPFPVGLRAFAGEERHRLAAAWAANGFASVVAAPLSALIALEWGSRALLLCAAAGYACGAGLLGRALRRRPETS